MAVRVLALKSGVTTLEDHRLLIGALLGGIDSAWPFDRRSGILYAGGTPAALTGSGMTASIKPFAAVVYGASSPTQGPYLVVSTETVEVTLADGEVAEDRDDLLGLVVSDDVYDTSGTVAAEVRVVDTDVDETYLPLHTVTVPQGASLGTGGIPWSSAVTDERVYTSTHGGVITVPDLSARARMSNVPAGTLVYVTAEASTYIATSAGWVGVTGAALLDHLDDHYQPRIGEWVPLTTESGITSSASYPLGICKTRDGLVYMRGTFDCARPINGTKIAQVPAGYEPLQMTRWVAAAAQSSADGYNSTRLEVRPNGEIWSYSLYAPGWVSVDGIVWWTA